MKIAYLCSHDTLPDAECRRADAFEHDLMMQVLQPAFRQNDLWLEAVDWRADLDWSAYAAALIGTTWDYCDNFPQFISQLASIESSTKLFNSMTLVRWNGCKTYLQDLALEGASVIPTLFFAELNETNLRESFAMFGTDLVCKYQTGAGAIGQHRIRLGDDMPRMNGPVMVQRFLPTILTDGEISFVFMDGNFSHAVCKKPKPGDYRIQSLYGGTENAFKPSAEDLAAARQILITLPEMPLYARVDMVRSERGTLMLMELELIEPYLYPTPDCALGEGLALALRKKLCA